MAEETQIIDNTPHFNADGSSIPVQTEATAIQSLSNFAWRRDVGATGTELKKLSELKGSNVYHPVVTQKAFADPIHNNLFEVTLSNISSFVSGAGLDFGGGVTDVIKHKARKVDGFMPGYTGTTIEDYYMNQPLSYFGDGKWESRDLTIHFFNSEDLLLENVIWMLVNGMDRINPNITLSGGTWNSKAAYTIGLQISLLSYGGKKPIRTISYGGAFVTSVTFPGMNNLEYKESVAGSAPTFQVKFRFDYPNIIL